MEFIQKLYFSVAILGCIAIFDVFIRLKRPLLLKVSFVLILASMSVSALIFSFQKLAFVFLLTPLKAIMTGCFLYVFYLLYFKQLKIWVTTYAIIIIALSFYVAWFNYTYFDYNQLTHINGSVGMVTNPSARMPLFLIAIRYVFVVYFVATIFYIWYQIYFHFKEENIYYDKIRIWTNFVLILSFLITLANIPLAFIRNSLILSNILTILVYFLLTLIILYRPDFLNRSSLKIAFGKKFNLFSREEVSELNFINEFFTKVYYKSPNASLEHLSSILNVSSNELNQFIYYNYSMTFNDLINKNRVNYFLDLIKKEEFKNVTIDALAKEVGFSNRQHLLKPFKKFHGGNPSDLLEVLRK